MGRVKKITTTHKVEQALRAADDFMNMRMLETATGDSRDQISAALFWLRQAGVVDVVVGADGAGWWMALPPESDQRSHTTEQITEHEKPRKRKTRARTLGSD